MLLGILSCTCGSHLVLLVLVPYGTRVRVAEIVLGRDAVGIGMCGAGSVEVEL